MHHQVDKGKCQLQSQEHCEVPSNLILPVELLEERNVLSGDGKSKYEVERLRPDCAEKFMCKQVC